MTMKAPKDFVCTPVSRVAVSWICVATNDGNPLHLDPEFAKKAGYKDVVVPGHILIGWMGQYLEELCDGDPSRILDWKIRFTLPVWPGDQFTLRGELGANSGAEDVHTVTVTAISQENKVCGIVTATLRTIGVSENAPH
jgi:acyl dehydratase